MAKKLRISLITVFILAIMLALVLCGINHSEDSAFSSTAYDYKNPTFTINTQSDFNSFVNTFSNTTNYFKDKTIYLNCSVDMGNFSSFLRRFDGTFYGNGNSISNLKNALFATDIASTGKIYDLVLNNVNITNSNSAIATSNYGQITNIKVVGNIINNSIGGLVYNNFGTILNCYNFASLDVSGRIDSQGVGGIAHTNYGTITNSHFLGNITANNTVKALGGLVAYNTPLQSVYPVISKSCVNGEIHINTTGDEGYDAVLPENLGTLIGNNLGILKNSYFIGYYSSYLALPILVVGNDNLIAAPTPYANIYMMTQNYKLVYDSANESFIEPIGDIKDYFDFIEPNGGIYVNENSSYPIFQFYDGQGTYENPFLLRNVFDLYKLRTLYNNVDAEYFVELYDDINCRNYTIEIAMQGFTYLSTIDGQGFALKNFAGSYLFAQNQETILFNTGFYNSPNMSITGTFFNETSGYEYGGINETVNDIAKQQPALGLGTELDPYIITTKEELAYLSDSAEYFKLGNSIVVNSFADANTNYLNNNMFSGVLDGNGYAIVGLFEQLVLLNTGTIKNLTIKGLANENATSLITSTNTSTGIIENITLYCSIPKTGIMFSGVADTNAGKISKVQVVGNDASEESMVIGICTTNTETGIIENCFIAMENTIVFAMSNNGNIASSIGKDAEYIAINNNAPVDMEYFSLVRNGFDVENVFGYEINTSYPYPTLRQKCVIYKASSDSIYDKTRTFTYTYSSATTYTKTNIQNLMKLKSEFITTGFWTYNGVEFNETTTFQDAGIYTVTLTFGGNNLYLPSKYTQTVTVNKQTQTSVLTFDGDSFNNITASYQGLDMEISAPAPNNLLECEYTYSYTLKQGTNIVGAIKNAGVYTQVITGESKNYSNVTKSRTITVTKVPITITLGNLSIKYLEDAVLENADITLNGLVEQDALKPIDQLKLTGTTPKYNTNYVKGNNVGEYEIGYQAEFTNYTVSSITKGKLFVNKIDQVEEGIIFADKSVTYTGNDIQITVENLPENATVVYDNNTYKNAGVYQVLATITRANYNDLVLSATLTIEKAELTFIPDDMSLSYAPTRTNIEQDFFTCDIQGGLGADDIQALINLLNLNYTITKDSEIVNVFDVGIYNIELEIAGELQNYELLSEKGSLEITPTSLTLLYSSHNNYTATYDGEIKTHPITFFETSISYQYKLGEEIVENCINAGIYSVEATVSKINDNYLDTIYTYTITIAKASIDISFENSTYTFEYDKTDKASEEQYPYVGTIPSGLSYTFRVTKGGSVVTNAIDAGAYVVSYMVAESENYAEKVINASLVITPKTITISVKPSYTYTGNNITPDITSITGAINGEVSKTDFTFTYFSQQMVPQERITKVGNYVIRAKLNKPNYTLVVTDYNVAINKITAVINLKYLEFSYGYTGLLSYGGVNYNIYSGGRIERKGYFVAETNVTMDISYTLQNEHAGIYTVMAINVAENYNFIISEDSKLNDNNKVKIKPFALSHIWKLGTTDITTLSKNIVYKGIDQISEFGYTIYGFLKGEKQQDFDFQIKEINNKPLYDTGRYRLEILLLHENNYVMNNAILEVVIEKVTLNVKMLNVEVFKGEQLVTRYEIATGLVGEDRAIGDIYRLKGANFNVNTNYTTQAEVGREFDYHFEGTFANYLLNITQIGKVKVIKNPKIPFTFSDSSFVYDGAYKSLKVDQSQEVIDSANVVLEYSANNYQKEVGTYTINLVVTYNIDNTQVSFTRTLTILQATPKVTLENNVRTVYRDNYQLSTKDIKGKAYLGTNEIAGTFVFMEDYILEKGAKLGGYQVKFVPADTKNFKETQPYSYNIESVVINLTALVYNDTTKISYSENGIDIQDTVIMSLNDSIIGGLSLYKNDVLVNSIVLDRNEDIVVSIKYQDTVVFSKSMKVVLEEKKDNVVLEADETCLDLISGLVIDKSTMLVADMGGRIALSAKYADRYALYINGLKVDTNYPINGNEGTLTIAIYDINSSFLLFSKQYEVKVSDISIKEPEKKDHTILIATVSVIGGAGLLVGLYFLFKKLIKDRKIGFNPYNKK